MATYNQLSNLKRSKPTTGSLIFYSREPRRTIYSPSASLFGVRRGPIYCIDAVSSILPPSHRSARIYSTASSWAGVKSGEGLIEQVELSPCADGSGSFTIRLKKQRDLWVICEADRLWLKACPGGAESATRFKTTMLDERQALCDEYGRPWCDWGEAGWNVVGCGEPLWCSFVADIEKDKLVRLEGRWVPDHEFAWPQDGARWLGSGMQVVKGAI